MYDRLYKIFRILFLEEHCQKLFSKSFFSSTKLTYKFTVWYLWLQTTSWYHALLNLCRFRWIYINSSTVMLSLHHPAHRHLSYIWKSHAKNYLIKASQLIFLSTYKYHSPLQTNINISRLGRRNNKTLTLKADKPLYTTFTFYNVLNHLLILPKPMNSFPESCWVTKINTSECPN